MSAKTRKSTKIYVFLCGDILVKMVALPVQWFDSVEHSVCQLKPLLSSGIFHLAVV